MKQAEDFRAESRALAAILEPLDSDDFDRVTQFRGWSVNHVLGHLHFFNVAARLSIRGGEDATRFLAPIAADVAAGKTILETQFDFIGNLEGRALLDEWRAEADRLADACAEAGPKTRVKWVGPEMSALSAITARQMETWAHGQEIFDLLGVNRQEDDRILNIAFLGVNTYDWSFRNRGFESPKPAPWVTLTAPSGAAWERNEQQENNRINGSAVDFARVVTQVRNIADTSLDLVGEAARRWMQIAQCFAGPPVDPPAPGTRSRAR